MDQHWNARMGETGECGAYESRVTHDKSVMICKWNNNNVVSVALNAASMESLHNVSCFSQKEKKRITIPQPSLIKKYNKGMVGVDCSDQNISLYGLQLEGKSGISHFSAMHLILLYRIHGIFTNYKRTTRSVDIPKEDNVVPVAIKPKRIW
ncbi:hypothetical protein PR048_012428 [Dryococelus australis]|uniref:PiggyBac transposable element-derived protein domain-containing protein n=1 Tax=Dryococelus australis TaxID=614101 RepID=A0ABQ9HPE4_9NEOP|nr:hypothetical protein PR048_012428 [Dryococelus australis]